MDQTTNNLKCKNKNVIKSRQSEASLAGATREIETINVLWHGRQDPPQGLYQLYHCHPRKGSLDLSSRKGKGRRGAL